MPTRWSRSSARTMLRPSMTWMWAWQFPEAGNWEGIIVAAPSSPASRTCSRLARPVPLRSAAEDFLADLGDVVGLSMTEPTEVTVSGLPASSVDLRVQPCVADITISADSGDRGFRTDNPFRLIATERNGQLIVIQIWALSDAELKGFRLADGTGVRGFDPVRSVKPGTRRDQKVVFASCEAPSATGSAKWATASVGAPSAGIDPSGFAYRSRSPMISAPDVARSSAKPRWR